MNPSNSSTFERNYSIFKEFQEKSTIFKGFPEKPFHFQAYFVSSAGSVQVDKTETNMATKYTSEKHKLNHS